MNHHGHRFIRFGLFCVAFTVAVALALGGCGTSGGSKYDDPIVALVGGINNDVSRFNGTHIYTIIAAQPANKPESDESLPVTYSFTLSTTAAKAPSSRTSLLPGGELGAKRSTLFPKQAENDLKMRRAENELLASKARQLSGRPTARERAITVGTKWNGVYIAVTGNTIDTTCRYISDHAYFFVDDRDITVMGPYLADYGAAFDQIYQINHVKFGRENDVDGNGKVIIIFSQELTGGLLGYFNAHDKFPQTVFEDSNEGDIFYITTDAEYQGDIVKGTLAHEFQHMIYFDEHYNRKATSTYTWLNEALSQAAEYYNGYLETHHAWIASFLYGSLEEGSLPNWAWGLSLTHWTSYNYGYGAIFIRYLIDQYGDAAIKNMCATSKVGVAAVEAATGKNFNLIFTEFARALVMSGAVASGNLYPRYRFTTLDLQALQPNGRGGLTTPYSFQAGDTIEGTIAPYEIRFFQWSGTFGNMNLSGGSVVGTAFGLDR
ncbi:MAG: hypothetical protein K6U03_02285 [Firmicutes bacterium]|nr:hypothetical protein [Bacillota bacterium]